MSKILVIGTGPLYSSDVKVFCAQSLRTWHIAEALRNAGHVVDLIVTQTDGYESSDDLEGQVTQARKDTFNYKIIHSFSPAVIRPVLQQALDAETYDGVVVVNVNVGAIVATLDNRAPLWADLMGHMMGEAQAKCGVEHSDDLLLHFWSRQRAVLRRADYVSASGFKQMYALLGELGAIGRLGRLNAAHQICSVIPIAADSMFLEIDQPISEKRFRGSLFPDDSFAVLWSGGYNTWTDVHALAAALTLAMEQVPRLRFVLPGGAIPGHNERDIP